MPRKGENIYRRKDGRWEGRYIKDRSKEGRAIYGYVYASSYLEAKNRLNAARSTCLYSTCTNDPARTIRFGDLAYLWMNTKKSRVKESTYNKYRNSLNSYILPHYNNIEISKISPANLESHISNLLCEGGRKKTGLSSKTVNDTLAIMRSIFRFARKNGFYMSNSVENITLKHSVKELSIFSLIEQKKLQAYLLQHVNNTNLGILICLLTGIRIGELCALRWEDLSLSEKVLYVHKTLQRIQTNPEKASFAKTYILISSPKSPSSIRKIPLPDCLIEHIKQYYLGQSGYLLTAQDRKYIEPRTLQNRYRHILLQCAIPYRNFHSLRHTFATRCVELGFDIKSLSEILGHANVNITMNRYVHPTMDLKRQNMNRLCDLFPVK